MSAGNDIPGIGDLDAVIALDAFYTATEEHIFERCHTFAEARQDREELFITALQIRDLPEFSA